MSDPIRKALTNIASGSASLHRHEGGEHYCAQCATVIDEARDALGWARLPAPPWTMATPDYYHMQGNQ